ncbi:hypothetical protein A0H81_12395 [Grifola frondosa]|uniref:Uncharacterized protein n=1 Tax=Grifola frondosa TaxID=5627 RepID=A0A1C7LST1_GRIFR|nr:hypothetical protein A0H81_12395 [Grifola frondosa]
MTTIAINDIINSESAIASGIHKLGPLLLLRSGAVRTASALFCLVLWRVELSLQDARQTTLLDWGAIRSI